MIFLDLISTHWHLKSLTHSSWDYCQELNIMWGDMAQWQRVWPQIRRLGARISLSSFVRSIVLPQLLQLNSMLCNCMLSWHSLLSSSVFSIAPPSWRDVNVNAHTGSRTRVTSMEGLYDAATLCVLWCSLFPASCHHQYVKTYNISLFDWTQIDVYVCLYVSSYMCVGATLSPLYVSVSLYIVYLSSLLSVYAAVCVLLVNWHTLFMVNTVTLRSHSPFVHS